MCIRLLFLIALLIAGTGCANQRPVYRGEVLHIDDAERVKHLNERTADRAATVVMNSGVSHSAQSLHVAADSTSWLDPSSGRVVSIKTSEIAGVRFKDSGRGAVAGLINGVIIGAALGATLGLMNSMGGGSGDGFFSSEERTPVGESVLTVGATLGGIGGLIGLVTGAASGGEEVYRLDGQPQAR